MEIGKLEVLKTADQDVIEWLRFKVIMLDEENKKIKEELLRLQWQLTQQD